ncbi:MAG: LysM peptidoglycan-binding domain-containing protein [Rhodothermaceae bacterium]|nr:LysM peptidoglycan-binding domain-containing protein [Bacteroidota bacterium]MXW13385.1 LysM peptidoglycan-binding domain-containing protein [Rhodothermaceae bacterium]MXW33578.1 LysM peptidoglycan-binding domain-containing protein [Rhodothermaceae bacterium]MYC04586.1 LysM peptidoglycan-binding domain-containing protein [Rhodothermaceae bacterium]MYE63334.1 LysM peptidoglycan-binding domain-containing protein [Rhodothermaceae bacterium]
MKNQLLTLFAATTLLITPCLAQQLMPPEAIPVEDLRGYDRYSMVEDYGDPRDELTERQIMNRISRAYLLQSRIIKAQTNGDWRSAEYYLDQAMSEVSVLADQSSLANEPQFRELFRTIVTEHEAYFGTDPAERQEYGSIFALRSAMFDVQALVENPTAEATGLPKIEPVVTAVPMPQNRAVENSIQWLLANRRETVIRWMNRSDTYFPMIEQIFKEEGVPEELKYLAVGESGLNPRARSSASAVGMWQFMAPTGRAMGLRIDSYVDERMDPVKSTRAAARHLKELYEYYASDWHLALAGYNCSPRCIRRAISRGGGTLQNPPSYWAISRYLPRQTSGYVPQFIAFALIMSNPSEFGLPATSNGPEFAYDEIKVSGVLSLETIATMVGTTTDHIESLNPELRRGTLPPDRSPYTLRIPINTFARFADAFEQLPEKEKTMPGEHRVRRGDNLGKIARRYGTTVKAIQNANRLRTTVIHPGQMLVVPGLAGTIVAKLESTGARSVGWGSRTNKPIVFDQKVAENARQTTVTVANTSTTRSPNTSDQATNSSNSSSENRPNQVHRVRRGDTLSELANQYGTTVRAIQQANGLRNTRIKRGQRLQIPQGGRTIHTVRRGENLTKIAQHYGTTVQSIKTNNNLRSNTIHPGQKLSITF